MGCLSARNAAGGEGQRAAAPGAQEQWDPGEKKFRSLFELPALQSHSGSLVRLSALSGKVILFALVHSAAPVNTQFEVLQQLFAEYSGSGLEILAFPSQDISEERFAEGAREAGYLGFQMQQYAQCIPAFEFLKPKGKRYLWSEDEPRVTRVVVNRIGQPYGWFTTADEGDMGRHLQQAITGPETASLANQDGRTGKARGLWMRVRSLFGV